jgi:D-glycero-D-manno-heptose 1,7-bisphosphate phosphatase
MSRAAFLDRDGTLNVKPEAYITRAEQIALIPGAAAAIRSLRQAGYQIVVATNQSAVARGLITPAQLDRIHARLVELLGAEDAAPDALYVCPHYRHGSVPQYAIPCHCRKPLPGLLHDAARQRGISLRDSVFVGDALRDLRAGRAAGTRTVLVLTGSGAETLPRTPRKLVDHVAADLPAAADWICGAGATGP